MIPGCDNCTHGWKQVLPSYGEREYPGLTAEELDALDPEARAVAELHTSMIREGLNSSVYPCRTCQPRQFYLWVEGHWDPDHVREGCPSCDPGSTKSRKRSAVMDPGPSEPPDLEPIGPPPAPRRRDLE